VEGWISIHRSICNHWIWSDPIKFWRWMDILLTVNHSDAKVNIGLKIIECKRGQSIQSLKTWGDRWRVNKDTARHFLNLLEKDGMIRTESLGNTTRITVCNYDRYQTSLHGQKTEGSATRDGRETDADPNNNDNNENNENKLLLIPPQVEKFEFKNFILLFNKLTNRSFKGDEKAKRQFNARIKEGYTEEQFKKAIENTACNDWFVQNPTYLTPEFLTRADKLEKYLNAKTPVGAGAVNSYNDSKNEKRIGKPAFHENGTDY
jgi:uncharacterized phage protein (TIGR02220 family)